MLKQALIGIILNGFALFAVTELVEAVIHDGGLKLYIFGGLIIGLLNILVKPVIKVLSFPFILLTGGVFLVFINAFILWLTSYTIELVEFQGVVLQFDGLGTYFISALLFGVINWAQHLIIKNR